MKKIYNLIIVFVFCQSVWAQDMHFSQWQQSSFYLNPASVGFNENHAMSLGAFYRSQWAGIPSAYRSFGANFTQNKNALSWAIGLAQQDAGSASYKTSLGQLALAYRKQLSNQQTLAVGISGGITQQGFNPNNLQFDKQYSSDSGFDKSVSSGENFGKSTITMPDLNAGIVWSLPLSITKSSSLTLGLAASHINQPKAGFFEDESVQLLIKKIAYARLNLPLNNSLHLSPSILFAQQAPAKELLVGADLSKKLSSGYTIYGGVANRMSDAWILKAGMEFNKWIVGLSYDINYSNLRPASAGNGAVELSAKVFFNAPKKAEVVENIIDEKSPEPELTTTAITNTPNYIDTDKDGVPDNLDECPTIPGMYKFNGCRDQDLDGIWDSKDACPNLAGSKENRGCPSKLLDTDQDGLVDEVDACPRLKGLVALNGCPDSDQDGIADTVDHCPYLKGVKEKNGCPNVSIDTYTAPSTTYIKPKFETVEFDVNQSIIKPQYIELLNDIVTYLLTTQNARVIISGHTDNEGNSAYNYALGQQRSQAILAFLIRNGIKRDRIELFSYGETNPIKQNKTVYGKARNRRAEIVIIE